MSVIHRSEKRGEESETGLVKETVASNRIASLLLKALREEGGEERRRKQQRGGGELTLTRDTRMRFSRGDPELFSSVQGSGFSRFHEDRRYVIR